MIIIDGNESVKSISTFENLEQALTSIMRDEEMEGRVITDVLVNDEAFSEIYPHQAEDITCDAISRLEVRSVPNSELAVDIAGEMGKVTLMMEHGARQVARLFREASDTDALELLQDLLDVTRDFMNMLGDLRGRYAEGDSDAFAEKTEKLSNLISEMSDGLENEDWILLSDLLEYEFLPICAEWREVSEQLRQQIIQRVAQ
ncbi:hypothetical protein [Desulfovibrio sp.]|uniref:hypothetical protein n=1 Tax=Desulfovibrio sp. TaxID=885 RepID=UPI0025B8F2E0|nr:hypothetical protein [Desulfovibrio sp.]